MESVYISTDGSGYIRQFYFTCTGIPENTGYCHRCAEGKSSRMLCGAAGNYRYAGSSEYIECKFENPGYNRTGNESPAKDFFCVTAKKIFGCKADAFGRNPEPLYE